MISKKLKILVSTLVLVTVFTFAGAEEKHPRAPKNPRPKTGRYWHGPDPKTMMGKWIMNFYANLPEYFALSEELMDRQKFRYTFGTMLQRGSFAPNSTKVFFVGQDATGIAEVAKIPGISGYGGQTSKMAEHFGVRSSVTSTNSSLSTINGQYGAFGHIYIEADAAGKPKIRKSKYVDNELWSVFQHPASELRIAREKHWEWLLMNNPESMDLMLVFGDAAKDSLAQFLIARGFDVPIRQGKNAVTLESLKKKQVPETILINAGGNAEFPVPVDRKGKDVYEILLRKYHTPEEFRTKFGKMSIDKKTKKKIFLDQIDYSRLETQNGAVEIVEKYTDEAVKMMVFTGGGIHGSGLVDIAQIADYDFDNVTFNGKKTRSLQGMKLKYFDATVERNVAFAQSEHPTALSKLTRAEQAERMEKNFAPLREHAKETGWKVTSDLDEAGKPLENKFAANKPYEAGKVEIGPDYLEEGAPANRRTSSADFVRDGKQGIVGNTRERATFDKAKLELAKKSTPSNVKNPNDLYSTRPRSVELRYIYDDGPGEDVARMVAESIDLDAILEPKKGMKTIDPKNGKDITFEKHGIDAYNVKSHPGAEYYGYFRGKFDGAKALILADPHGVDDWTTSRALTGGRGQYLNGLMGDLGFGDDYLVIKTVPFAMDDATPEEWEVVRKQTEKYREGLIKRALENKIEIIMVDGPVAKAEMDRILKKQGVTGISVVEVKRTGLTDFAEGIVEAGNQAAKALGKSGVAISGKHLDIPTNHLPYTSRLWEGTGGVDLTIDASGKMKGLAHELVTPNWAAYQKVNLLEATKRSIARIRAYLARLGIRIGKEPMDDFLKKTNGDWYAIEKARQAQFASGTGFAGKFLSPEECAALLKKSIKTVITN